MFCIYTEVIAQDDTVIVLNNITLLPMSKVDQS